MGQLLFTFKFNLCLLFPRRLPGFVIGPQYHCPKFLLAPKHHSKDMNRIHKNPCGFKNWSEFVRYALISLKMCICIWSFLQSLHPRTQVIQTYRVTQWPLKLALHLKGAVSNVDLGWWLRSQFPPFRYHYDDVIMGAMAFQINGLTIVYLTVYSGANQRKHQSYASPAFVRGIYRWPVNSPHKWSVTRKMFPFDAVINF